MNRASSYANMNRERIRGTRKIFVILRYENQQFHFFFFYFKKPSQPLPKLDNQRKVESDILKVNKHTNNRLIRIEDGSLTLSADQ